MLFYILCVLNRVQSASNFFEYKNFLDFLFSFRSFQPVEIWAVVHYLSETVIGQIGIAGKSRAE
jgi:hypothetical protein